FLLSALSSVCSCPKFRRCRARVDDLVGVQRSGVNVSENNLPKSPTWESSFWDKVARVWGLEPEDYAMMDSDESKGEDEDDDLRCPAIQILIEEKRRVSRKFENAIIVSISKLPIRVNNNAKYNFATNDNMTDVLDPDGAEVNILDDLMKEYAELRELTNAQLEDLEFKSYEEGRY
ncbi:hypothetical protein LINPERPRIM_LOCUS31283, partial [Linum perenne]